MRRILAIIIAVVILFSLTITAYAETEGSMTITTTVVSNPPTWSLSIPADIDIPYQQEAINNFGTVQITELSNPDKHSGWVDIFISYENLKSGSNEIPLKISGSFENASSHYWNSGEKFKFTNNTGSVVYDHAVSFNSSQDRSTPICLSAYISKYDWEHAKPGTYSTTLTFTTQYGGFGVDYGN